MDRDPDSTLEALGRHIRERRLHQRLTVRELARRASLSERFLGQVESGRGNISVLNLTALATALGTDASSLLANGSEASPPQVVALLGLRGAGKTTIGRALARRLHARFIELDERVEKLSGLPLAEIFRLHGESYYRQVEARALESVLAETGPRVVATGGGIVTSPATYARLREGAVTVWLRARPKDHWARVVGQGDRRPIEARPQAMTELRRLLATREPLYAEASHALDTSRLGVPEAVRALEERLVKAATLSARSGS
jgi:XRE family aerobic/anaerobic benzoate catabolism transcriptional regulator